MSAPPVDAQTPAVRHTATVMVPSQQMTIFREQLKRLNAKAERFGLEPIRAGIPRTRMYEVLHIDRRSGSGYDVVLHPEGSGHRPAGAVKAGLVSIEQIPLEYPVIKLGDWQVVAQIEEGPGGGNLIFTVSQNDDAIAEAEAHRHQPLCCEHCGSARARKTTFLLSGPEGYKEVGKTCLEDFTGIDPASVLFIAKMDEFVATYSEDASSARVPNTIETHEYLKQVAFVIEQRGFVSTSAAEERGLLPTYSVAEVLPFELSRDAKLRAEYVEASERLDRAAEGVREWYALNASPTGFDANVRAMLAGDRLPLKSKYLAFVAGAYAGYKARRERQAREAEEAASLTHVGCAGEKMITELRLARIIRLDTKFGPSALYLLRDRNGNHVTWKSASPTPEEFRNVDEAHWFECQFKVKEHDIYRSAPQTTVTHLKVLGPALTEAPEPEPEEPSPAPGPG